MLEELKEQLKNLDEVIDSATEMHNMGMNLNKEIVDLLEVRERLVNLINRES